MTKKLGRTIASLFCAGALTFGAAACQPMDPADGGEEGVPKDLLGKADSSNQATVLNFAFDSELVTDSLYSGTSSVIQDQLLFTIGHLNANRSVGRLDKVTLSNVKTSKTADGKTKVTYHADMPVAWGSKTNLPATYGFKVPRDVSWSGQEAFATKYKASCVDWGAHDVDAGSMWYYYRPAASGCKIDDADVVAFTAKVSVSPTNTTGKYPEYNKVWEDGELRVVAIFGKYEDGATSTSDAGISAFNEFVGQVKRTFAANGLATVPANVAAAPAPAVTDVTFTATVPAGKVTINAILVDSITNVPAGFDARYADLSSKADLIAYNGHAGLGQNVRALARKGHWVAGQYVIVFMNGCDTFAYVDGYLAQTRAAINPDDPTGTKYMDFVVNAMPAFFASDSEASMALINGLLQKAQPRTYERMFADIDNSQVVLVTGEEDNAFVPGGAPPPPPPSAWTGLSESGTVAKSVEQRYQTPTLPAGSYTFKMTGTGDADLYVRSGMAPTTSNYECRPYLTGSNETCTIKLNTAAPIHVMVRGYSSSSTFKLVGKQN